MSTPIETLARVISRYNWLNCLGMHGEMTWGRVLMEISEQLIGLELTRDLMSFYLRATINPPIDTDHIHDLPGYIGDKRPVSYEHPKITTRIAHDLARDYVTRGVYEIVKYGDMCKECGLPCIMTEPPIMYDRGLLADVGGKSRSYTEGLYGLLDSTEPDDMCIDSLNYIMHRNSVTPVFSMRFRLYRGTVMGYALLESFTVDTVAYKIAMAYLSDSDVVQWVCECCRIANAAIKFKDNPVHTRYIKSLVARNMQLPQFNLAAHTLKEATLEKADAPWDDDLFMRVACDVVSLFRERMNIREHKKGSGSIRDKATDIMAEHITTHVAGTITAFFTDLVARLCEDGGFALAFSGAQEDCMSVDEIKDAEELLKQTGIEIMDIYKTK
jgi:hypothetical protein